MGSTMKMDKTTRLTALFAILQLCSARLQHRSLSDDDDGRPPRNAHIVAIVLGVFLFVFLLFALVCFRLKRRSTRQIREVNDEHAAGKTSNSDTPGFFILKGRTKSRQGKKSANKASTSSDKSPAKKPVQRVSAEKINADSEEQKSPERAPVTGQSSSTVIFLNNAEKAYYEMRGSAKAPSFSACYDMSVNSLMYTNEVEEDGYFVNARPMPMPERRETAKASNTTKPDETVLEEDLYYDVEVPKSSRQVKEVFWPRKNRPKDKVLETEKPKQPKEEEEEVLEPEETGVVEDPSVSGISMFSLGSMMDESYDYSVTVPSIAVAEQRGLSVYKLSGDEEDPHPQEE